MAERDGRDVGTAAGLSMPGALREAAPVEATFTGAELQLLNQYHRAFLKPCGLREALYCDRCYAANRSDGVRATMAEHWGIVTAHFACRCRVFETKGVVH